MSQLVYKTEYSALLALVKKGMTQKDIAERLNVSPGTIAQWLRKFQLYQLWHERCAAKPRPKKASEQPAPSERLKVLLPILDEFEARGFRVVRGRFYPDCRVEGLKISVHQPTKICRPVKKYPKLAYYTTGCDLPFRLNIAILPNGTRYFFMPSGRWNRKRINIHIKYENLPEQWPTKADFRRAKSLLALLKRERGLDMDFKW